MITIKSFEVNYFSENTYLLYDDTKEAVLIDCGCLRKEEQKEVSDFIAQNGLTLKRYLCTHLHLDHIFGNEFVHNTYGLSPEAHKADVEGLPSPEEQAKAFGLPMKAKSGAEELAEAENAIGTLRAKLRFCEEFTIFDTESAEEPQTRMIAGIEKIGETEKIYPRNFSQIKKKPL